MPLSTSCITLKLLTPLLLTSLSTTVLVQSSTNAAGATKNVKLSCDHALRMMVARDRPTD